MPIVKLVIDDEEVFLEPAGKSRKGTYEKYSAPDEFKGAGIGDSPLIATVYLKPGWLPSKGK